MSANASTAKQISHASPLHAANDDGVGGGDLLTQQADNLVARTVAELCALMGESHDLREDLNARGVPFHTVNSMIERGCRLGVDKAEELINSAAEAARNEHGGAAVGADDIRESLEQLVTIELDLRHARQVAGKQGLNMQAINHLTQMIRSNAGDGGVNTVNTLVAYASAAGISLGRVQSILEKHADEPASVLPDIDRESLTSKTDDRRKLIIDLLIGIGFTLVFLWVLR